MPEVRHGSLPFDEAIAFFRQKVRLPTRTWTDIVHGMHARAFVIAGATKDDLLADFQGAIDRAIADGTTLEQFRKAFDGIVAKHGWDYNGGRNWRSRVIYDTNVRTAYMAGRYEQMTQPDVLDSRPFWEYRHGDSAVPRPMHLAWDGKVLAADDPWWQTHYPPNGWGCRCKVFTLSRRDLAKLGKSGPDEAPPLDMRTQRLGRNGPVVQVPAGVDPGWGYNVGEAAWGRPLAEEAVRRWAASGAGAWERLTPGDWQSYARPAAIPLDAARAAPGAKLGTDPRVLEYPGGAGRVYVDPEVLDRELGAEASPNLRFLPETIEDPFEIWLAFERHRGSGQVVLRTRAVKAVKTAGPSSPGTLLAAQARSGQLEAWTSSSAQELQKQRVGKLLYARRT